MTPPTNLTTYLNTYIPTTIAIKSDTGNYLKLPAVFHVTSIIQSVSPFQAFQKATFGGLGLGWVGHSARSGFDLAQVMTTGRPTNHVYVRHISALNVHHNSA